MTKPELLSGLQILMLHAIFTVLAAMYCRLSPQGAYDDLAASLLYGYSLFVCVATMAILFFTVRVREE